MSNHDPIAYTYEADVHCPACSEARFGRDGDGFIASQVVDREGNEPGAIAPWDETPSEGLYCGDCHTEIAPHRAHVATETSPRQGGLGMLITETRTIEHYNGFEIRLDRRDYGHTHFVWLYWRKPSDAAWQSAGDPWRGRTIPKRDLEAILGKVA